jgi:hypothetical protein
LAAHRLNEVDLVQNSAFGAVLLWQFGLAYQQEGTAIPSLPLSFIVLPVCLHASTVAVISSTRKSSGLSLFAAKLGEVPESLLAIHARARALRALSFGSLAVASRSGLVTVHYEIAAVRSNDTKPPLVPERLKHNVDAAAKLGYWCSNLSLGQIANLLKLEF